MKNIFYCCLFTILITHGATTKAVTLTCNIHPSAAGENITVALSGNISVGNDIPIGSVIYSAYAKTSNNTTVMCNPASQFFGGKVAFQWIWQYGILPSPPVPGLYLSANETVYQTNLPGIGVVLQSTDNYPLPYISSALTWKVTNPGQPDEVQQGSGRTVGIYLKLVKTGPASSGVVYGNTLPSLTTTVEGPIPVTGYTFTGFPLKVNNIQFSGQINIASSTCELKSPSINVPMGTYSINDFRGPGSPTEWKVTNIDLVGCSTFNYGYYSENNTTISQSGNGTFPIGIPDVTNKVTVNFAAAGSMIDQQNGILNINQTAQSASGVGIQVGIDQGGYVNSVPFLTPVDVGVPVSGSLNIPVRARYIQTEDEVKPGRADGAVVFTINYY